MDLSYGRLMIFDPELRARLGSLAPVLLFVLDCPRVLNVTADPYFLNSRSAMVYIDRKNAASSIHRSECGCDTNYRVRRFEVIHE